MSDEESKILRLKVILSVIEGTLYSDWQSIIDIVERLYETKQPDEIATRKRVDDFRNLLDKIIN